MDLFCALFGSNSHDADRHQAESDAKQGKQQLQSLSDFIGEPVPRNDKKFDGFAPRDGCLNFLDESDEVLIAGVSRFRHDASGIRGYRCKVANELSLSPVPSTASIASDSSDDSLYSAGLQHTSSSEADWQFTHDAGNARTPIGGIQANVDVEVLSLGGNTVATLRDVNTSCTHVWEIKNLVSRSISPANFGWKPMQMQLRYEGEVLENSTYLQDVIPDGVGCISLTLLLQQLPRPKLAGSYSRKLTGFDSDSD